MNFTDIEWTHRPGTDGMTWNPIHAHSERLNERGTLKTGNFCTKISPGCANCYASRINVARGNGLEYTVPNLEKAKFYIDEKELAEPLKRKKPTTIFVGDMFDLFHEAIPDDILVRVFRAMCDTHHIHTFQVLTKRAKRMQQFFANWNAYTRDFGPLHPYVWPRRNIWLGVSVESQKYADERIPLLLQTPAAIRFLSVEPLLEEVKLRWPWVSKGRPLGGGPMCNLARPWEEPKEKPAISWVICGGESGPGARPFNLAWAESLRDQCRAAEVPFFFKQAGSLPILSEAEWREKYDPITHGWKDQDGSRFWLSARANGKTPDGTVGIALKDRKGGDPSEWPESLRIREFPA